MLFINLGNVNNIFRLKLFADISFKDNKEIVDIYHKMYIIDVWEKDNLNLFINVIFFNS